MTGALTIPALSDIYGRRKTFLWCAGCSIIMFILQAIFSEWKVGTPDEDGIMRFENNNRKQMWAYYLINVTMFVNGAVSTSRKSIGFCFITELAPKLY